MDSKEKAKLILDAMVAEDGLDVPAMMQRKLEKRIEAALNDKERDTRHACAEAVNQCEDQNDMCADSDIKWIDAEDAHNACMNTNVA